MFGVVIGRSSRQGCHRSTIDISVHGKRSKKKREYGSGRAEMGTTNAPERLGEGPGAAEYLHFGRLIGERAEESKDRLDRSSVDVSKDPRAELYLEKWSQEEEMSYSMFETLLEGGDVASAAIKDLSFEDIMRDSEEGIQTAFENIVLPRRAVVTKEEDSESVPHDDEMLGVTTPEPEAQTAPPTYETFQDLLDPGMRESPKEETNESVPSQVQEKQGKKRQNVAKAIELSSRDAFVDAKVWQCNASGVLVDADGVTGFVPFNQLDDVHASKVVSAQQKARISLGPQAEDAAVRRGGMNILMGALLHVKVLRIDQDLGRVIFTEKRSHTRGKSTPLTESVLHIAADHVGKIVDVEVTNLTEFGVFVKFSLPKVQGSLVGLVYVSEVSWDPTEVVGVTTGDTCKAKLIHVDTHKKHIFLSFKRTTPNPLLETLDTLLGSRENIREGNADSNRDTIDASADLRPLEGDMKDAVDIVMSLKQAGFPRTRLGPRLRSKASSQTIEVYLSKASDEGSTTMIVRKGYDVQEIVVPSTDRKRLINIVSKYQSDN